MKRLYLILSLLYFLFIPFSIEASVVRDTGKTYVVNAVRAEGASFENEQSTKQIALEQARQLAFNDVMQHMQIEDLSFDDVNISSAISSYSIVDEYYNENFYSIIANFTFDKDILNSIIRKIQQNIRGKGEIADYAVLLKEKDDIIKEYVTFMDFLKKEKIKSYIMKIEPEEVTIALLQVDENRIYSSLKQLGLNGKIYLK